MKFRLETLQMLGKAGTNNPLTSVGLGPQIYEIGLTDEELIEYCRYLARFLVAKFHPDRSTADKKRSAVLHRRFSAAFAEMKNDVVLSCWLDELKEPHKLKRDENASLQQANRQLRELLDLLREQLSAEQTLRKKTQRELGEALAKVHTQRRSR
jgi:hypothetical protein